MTQGTACCAVAASLVTGLALVACSGDLSVTGDINAGNGSRQGTIAEAERPRYRAVVTTIGVSGASLEKNQEKFQTHPLQLVLAAEPVELHRTQLDSSAAARSLAIAWRELTGKRLRPRGLAVLIAHWALETGRGRNMVAHNFGGLKAPKSGDRLELWTRERVENEYVQVRESFRAYPSRELGARDYVQLLKRRYPRAFLAVRHGEVKEFVDALRLGGYFTDDAGLYARAMQSLWFEYLSTGVAARAFDQVI